MRKGKLTDEAAAFDPIRREWVRLSEMREREAQREAARRYQEVIEDLRRGKTH